MATRRSRPPDAEGKSSHDLSKKICRCCLTTEKHLKNALEFQEYFMELAGINVTVSDGMPSWVCVECSALMKKGIGFKYKMLRAQSVLYDYLMKCAPGQFNVNDPELTRYRAPNLSATETLVFDNTRERYGYHDTLQQEKQLLRTELFEVPLLPVFENPCSALDSVEAAFSDEDDPLERLQTEKKDVAEDDNTNEDKEDSEEKEDNEDKDDNEEKDDNDDDMDNEDIDNDDIDDDDLIDDEEDMEEEEDLEEEEEMVMSSDFEDSDSEPLVKKKGKKKKKKDIKLEKISYSPVEELIQPPEIIWTSENDEILIEFVKRNEALYNPKSKTYKIGVLKKKLWIDIGVILNKSDVECCKRWNYVRDYYIRRRGKRASGGEAARRRAALLSFLDAVPSTARAGWPREEARPQPVKEESTTNFEHLWEQIRIGDQFSKMSGVAWTSAKEELLIDFVRRHEALYNPRSKDFRKPQVKQKLWCDIGAMLNKSDTDCSKRWCYVRDYYTRRKSNPGALSTGKAAKRRAELLSFLDYVPPPGRAPLSPLPPQESLMKEELESSRLDNAAHSSDYRGTTYSKMSSTATWSGDQDERLINFVRKHESLFNAKSKDFRKARLKQRLWRELANMLNKSASDCYKRWCYVRDYYIRRRAKPGVLSTGRAARRRAELLAFLDDVPAAAKTAQEMLMAERREETLEGAISDLFHEQYSKMTSNVTWSWEQDETLIKFVRRNEPLYNPKSRNTQLKQRLWNEIASTLRKTDAECCKRWCYVRDYYRRRSRLAPCGESARRRAQLLSFLERVPAATRGHH